MRKGRLCACTFADGRLRNHCCRLLSARAARLAGRFRRNRSRQQIPLGELYPSVANSSFVAPNATLVGDVNVGDGCYVGYGVVLRGDQSPVEIYHKVRPEQRGLGHCWRASMQAWC